MDAEQREKLLTATFSPTAAAERFEATLRQGLGLSKKYETARLCLGRSLVEPRRPDPVPENVGMGKSIRGQNLFGDDLDLWIATLLVDGQMGEAADSAAVRKHAEAHWARGARLLEAEWDRAGERKAEFLIRLAEFLPSHAGSRQFGERPGPAGRIAVPIGSVSTLSDSNEPVEICLNRGGAPHVAFMGATNTGKSTTASQMVAAIVEQADVPVLFIDPKGEFSGGSGGPGRLPEDATRLEVGAMPIPLDFLPTAEVGSTEIAAAAMRFRDSLAAACRGIGDVQKDTLRAAVEEVIRRGGERSLREVRDAYERTLQERGGKSTDVVLSRLTELTRLSAFEPEMPPEEFFAKSWIVGLNRLPGEELRNLSMLLLLDALRTHVLSAPDAAESGGFRRLRHLLVVDEARRILKNKNYESLADLLRQGRSKGQVVMLLSQDPSDFQGQADDFTTQLGTVVAFACNQSTRGLRALEGAFGRKLQPAEFSDSRLDRGVAFCKLPGREPVRVRCWAPSGGGHGS